MKKYIIPLFLLIFIIQGIFSKTYTYDNFNGKYQYNDLNSEGHSINISSNIDEEILFIMDFSGSMSKKMGYSPKVYLAIDAIRAVLADVGTRTKIGLRIFGVTDAPTVERYGNKVKLRMDVLCTASRLVLPIARYNNSNISDKLSKYTPQGATPITFSLKQAVQNDFSPNAQLKHIILVSDGNENCGEDPCAFIRNLMTLRDDYKIDVIGITVDQNAYSQLSCIANAGKGKYFSVDNPTEFVPAFRNAVKSTVTATPTVANPVVQVQPIKKDLGTKFKNYAFEFNN